MEGAKLLDMLPENLREAFIEEVDELLKERAGKGKTDNKKIDEEIQAWAKANEDKSRKPVEF